MSKINLSLKNQTNTLLEERLANKKEDSNFCKLVKSLELSSEEVKRNLSSLEDTLCELENCKKCPGLAKCKNHIAGYVYYPQKN